MIVDVNDDIKKIITDSNFSSEFIDNCLNSKFLAIMKNDSKVIGCAFVGGFLNSYGIEILEGFRGQGISKKLLNEVIHECKKRKISMLTGVFKPSNLISIKLHTKVGFIPVFSIYYNKIEKREIIVILPINHKASMFLSFSRFFNNRFGNFVFILLFKILNPILKNMIAFSGDKIPKIDFILSIKNFKTVQNVIAEIESK